MQRNYQKCPRCGEKNSLEAIKCSYCGLIFSRLNLATNKAAKKAVKDGKKNKVVYVTYTPKDISRTKLIMLTFFTGMFGGQYYYVGRYTKAALFTFWGSIFLTGFILSANSLLKGGLTILFGLPTGFLGIAWILDMFDVIFYRFKIPVYIDPTVDEKKEETEEKSSVPILPTDYIVQEVENSDKQTIKLENQKLDKIDEKTDKNKEKTQKNEQKTKKQKENTKNKQIKDGDK